MEHSSWIFRKVQLFYRDRCNLDRLIEVLNNHKERNPSTAASRSYSDLSSGQFQNSEMSSNSSKLPINISKYLFVCLLMCVY